MPSFHFDGDPTKNLKYGNSYRSEEALVTRSVVMGQVITDKFFKYSTAAFNPRWLPYGERTLNWVESTPFTAVSRPVLKALLPDRFSTEIRLDAEVNRYTIIYPTFVSTLAHVGGGAGSIMSLCGLFCILIRACLGRLQHGNFTSPR